MIILAHRGFSSKYPENTLLAFENALKSQADGIEFDIQLTRDKIPIVFHDFSLKRLTGIKSRISDLNFEEIRKIKLPQNQFIPTFEEVLEIIPKNRLINIELKGKGTALQVFGILERKTREKKLLKKDIIVSSFNHNELKTFRRYDKGKYKLGVIVSGLPVGIIGFSKKLSAYCINPSIEYLNLTFAKMLQKKNFKIFAWVVNTKKQYHKAKQLNLDGIFTDFPDLNKNL